MFSLLRNFTVWLLVGNLALSAQHFLHGFLEHLSLGFVCSTPEKGTKLLLVIAALKECDTKQLN